MKRHLRALLLACGLLPLGGCATSDGRWVELRGQRFEVEIAADEASRVRGLMFRTSMPADHGMLFVFEHEQPQAFWMRNTYIPLDILYFDAQRRLVGSALRVPPCRSERCPSYPSGRPARFVLELNAGRAEQLGVKPGDPITFGPAIRD